ncbi:MAG: hypothetical protein MR598_08355 [Erysipelotrichaceae bacterium]|nr:hypothetical protein [Erysipelotrichaceae bacterium]
MRMKQEYYTKLANQLLDSVETINLGDKLELLCCQYADILRDDVLDMYQKHQVSILAEELLSCIKDIPPKEKRGSKRK